jgi:hypothetical protein
MQFREADSCETYGLDCGPYEHVHAEWWECPACAARFSEQELLEAVE